MMTGLPPPTNPSPCADHSLTGQQLRDAVADRASLAPLLLHHDRQLHGTRFADVLSNWRGPGHEAFLFITPHDDDPILGAGLVIAQAIREGLPVRIAVVTDGRNGYVTAEQRETIGQIRREETERAYAALGVQPSAIDWLGFPDTNLTAFVGRKPHRSDGPQTSPGMTGLEDAFVRLLRSPVNGVPVSRIFTPVTSDLHPDHVVVGNEVPICIFHATGGIWPELGPKLADAPVLYSYPVYCAFPPTEPANVLLRGTAADFDAKIQAIAKYQSQGQIGALVDSLRARGPVEVLREVSFRLFDLSDAVLPFFDRRYSPGK